MQELTGAEQRITDIRGGRVVAPAVLVVEDDLEIGQAVVGLLSGAGYRGVTIADHDGIGAAVKRWRPSCVLIDGALPSTGVGRPWSDAIAIRNAHPGLPVLMFTADAAAAAEARAGTSVRSHAAGFAGIVGKPFVAAEFLATVRAAVDGHAVRRVSTAVVEERALATTVFPAVAFPPDAAARAAFFGTVVHELRTPLTVISSQIQLARRYRVRDPEREGAALEAALVHVSRMDRLIGELLDGSRVEAGALKVDAVVFDLCAVIADVVRQHAHRSESARIAFRPARRVLRVRGDPFRVAQIVGNLVENALRYGRPESDVALSLRVIGGTAQLRVEDHGVGVPSDERSRLFEPFYRSSRTRTLPGTGLGLYLSRRLAELQGGRLWLERSTESGSVFALDLPAPEPSKRWAGPLRR